MLGANIIWKRKGLTIWKWNGSIGSQHSSMTLEKKEMLLLTWLCSGRAQKCREPAFGLCILCATSDGLALCNPHAPCHSALRHALPLCHTKYQPIPMFLVKHKGVSSNVHSHTHQNPAATALVPSIVDECSCAKGAATANHTTQDRTMESHK